ncbi:hypothetical protein BAE44_0021538 [Dichanthelium oligosanthes]|uniref:Fe2OG dioxygenase domain-containing protein n=1 Tax=Dichanthelium oligosanthes TaxID=888268 RepID=A0A1E5UX34_9POAL|nr:hypothetical protein BAE44_0021538 [Dichanthelium oligosanthes]
MTTAAGMPGSPAGSAAAAAGGPAAPEVAARDAVIGWFRGEFAAANAMIDALCGHLAQIGGGGAEYEAAFAALHRRRANWFPILHMQKFYPVADVTAELRRVADARAAAAAAAGSCCYSEEEAASTVIHEPMEDLLPADPEPEPEPEQDPIQQQDPAPAAEEEADAAIANPVAEVEYHEPDAEVNVVKGLKIYEDVFTTSEIMKVADFINEIRQAGRNGELSGETFIFFNKQIKGNKREIIQLGVPLFQPTTEEANCHIEPIPLVLQAVIDHLVLWRLIPESRKPNSVIINFFDEDEHSQPYFKPPHLDNPISTLLLSETTMAFGRSLVTDSNGNYKGPLTLSLKQGSLLVMRGNSADMARHVVCPSSNRRVSITFARVRPSTPVDLSPLPSPTKAMTPWQPQPPAAAQLAAPPCMAQKAPVSGAIIGYAPAPQAVLAPAAWGMAVRAPVMMVAAAPARPMVMASSGAAGGNVGKRMGRSGTGVFLPWTVGPKRYNKHLPPRIQKRRFSAMMSPIEAQG